MIILRNARLLSALTENFEGTFADVVLEDGIIQEIKEAKTAKITSEKDVIDLTGKTLLPGLIEAHLHLDLCGMNVYEENVQQESYRMMRALRLALDNLKMGYTTVQDLGDRNNLVIGIARAVKEGLIMGPDILASGKILSRPKQAMIILKECMQRLILLMLIRKQYAGNIRQVPIGLKLWEPAQS